MKEFDTEESIARLANRVLDCSLPHAEWTHAAHFGFALWMLRHRPEHATPEYFRVLITRLNDAQGTPNTDVAGYHHTITVASLAAAKAVLGEHAGDTPLHEVLAGLLEGPFGRSDWILAYWSRECLFSVPARRDWVEPDLGQLLF